MADIERIRQRAYEIWVEEGQPHGRDQEHWLRAEAEIGAAAPAATPQRRAPRKPASAPAKASKAAASKPKASAAKKTKA